MSSERTRVYAGLAALGLAAAALLWWATREEPKGPAASASPSAAAVVSSQAPARPEADALAAWQSLGGAVDAGVDAPARTPAEERLALAQDTLDSYLKWARYPPQSRPLSDHPDLLTTSTGSSRKQLFVRKSGVKRTDVIVSVSQSAAFVVGDESVLFQVTCESEGRVLPCAITGAEASAVPVPEGVRPVQVRFADDGVNGDEKAADSTFTALFKPSATSLAGKDARIGVAVWLRYQGDDGQVFFQIDYTAAEPARFTGKVTEALENGSLALDLEMEVTKPGRYVLAARVDDANGNGFAFLDHNAELAAGTAKARMIVFGKLVKDTHAVAPFKVRDLNGFLLKEDTSPDREVIRDVKGVFFTTKAWADADFSNAEWQSEEKKRHVDEFTKDLNQARAGSSGSVAPPGGGAVAPP